MTYLLLALAIAANIAALVNIAVWYRRDRDERHGEHDAEWAGECLRLHALKASAEADARQAEERRQGAFDANVNLARKRREADDEVFRVTQEFREHIDGHACLPTLDGVRAANTTRGLPPEDLALIAGGQGFGSKVVPLHKRGAK
jgi:hypothetical protein